MKVLRGVDLTVTSGEAVGIVGPSGSGKTSLLMLLAGLERPTAGRLSVAGRDLAALDEDALARFRRDEVGIVFQAFHLVPTMTALENVAMPLEFAGRRDAFERAGGGAEGGRARPPAGALPRPAVGRRAAARRRWPAPWWPSRG